MTTKEQERKALDQIRKIVDGLGEGSYLAMAFEGAFDDAEENIENDFAVSMKQRWESAKKDADYFHKVANDEAAEIKRLEENLGSTKNALAAYQTMYDDMATANTGLLEANGQRDAEIDSLNGLIHDRDMEILVLKARLFDLLCKE